MLSAELFWCKTSIAQPNDLAPTPALLNRAHNAHRLLANLAVLDGPRARAVYAKIMTAYNAALLPDTPAIPPFEEWQGVSSYCDHYNCRWVFLCSATYASSDRGGGDREVICEAFLQAESTVFCICCSSTDRVLYDMGCWKF